MLRVLSRPPEPKKTRLSHDDLKGRLGNARVRSHIERAVEQKLVWKQFIEGVRVMKLTYHIGALKHYMSLTKNHEITLNLLMDLKESSSLTEYQSVVH